MESAWWLALERSAVWEWGWWGVSVLAKAALGSAKQESGLAKQESGLAKRELGSRSAWVSFVPGPLR